MREANLMIFDTASLYYRAFFGLPSSLRARDGRPVNAIRGLFDAMASMMTTYRPSHVACAWDEAWRPTWRVSALPVYKAARANADGDEIRPDGLDHQIEIIKELLENLGLAPIGVADHEADDVCASLAAHFEGRVVIVTGDRDMFSLVDDRVRVAYVGSGIKKHALVDPAWVRAKYAVSPDRYVDFALLRGDPSDGISGVPGIGEKTAARLIAEYACVEAMIDAAKAAALRPRICSSIIESATEMLRARVVLRPVAELDLPQPTALPLAAASICADDLNISSSLARLIEALERPA